MEMDHAVVTSERKWGGSERHGGCNQPTSQGLRTYILVLEDRVSKALTTGAPEMLRLGLLGKNMLPRLVSLSD